MSERARVPAVVMRAAHRLLACYPRWFRDAYGASFMDAVESRWRKERARGRGATAVTLALLLIDTLRAAPRAWRFRNAGAVRESGPALLGGIGFELRYALRVIVRSPAFSVVAIASLAIGIGANTAIYRAARYAIMDPMPVSNPEALRLVHWATPSDIRVSQYNSSGGRDAVTGRSVRSNFNHAMYRALRESAGEVPVAGFNFVPPLAVSRGGQPAVAASGLMVSGNWFEVLEPGLALGRQIVDSDDDPAAPPVVVLSHGFWERVFGSDPGVIGSVLSINGATFTVVGVTAKGFHGISTGGRVTPLTDVTVPLAWQPLVWPQESPLASAPNVLWIRALARIPDGVSEAALQSRLTASQRRTLVESGIGGADSLSVVESVLQPGGRGVDALRVRAQGPVTVLAGVVALVLVIACANLAGLMLARGVARQREMAVRRALGSGRARLLRQLFLESLLLSLGGGVAGLALALGATPFVNAMLAAGLGVPTPALPLDWRTILVALGVSVAAALGFGLLPALRLTRDDAAQLRHRADAVDAPRMRTGRVLLAAQIGVSVPLVVATGLLLRTVHNLGGTDLGFDPRGVVVVRTELPGRAVGGEPERGPLSRRLLERVEAIPGVRSATLIENVLLSGWTSNNSASIEGVDRMIWMNAIGPRFFETMGMELVAGRSIGLQDDAGAPRVVVINEAAAREFFAGVPPIGRRFTYGPTEAEVVGIVRDSRYSSVRTDILPTLYDSWLQRADGWVPHLLLRVGPGLTGLEPELRQAVAEVSPDIVIAELRLHTEYVNDSVSRERLMTRLLIVFGAFALLLACIGLYGVASYSVARRTHEIGIRIALGAERPRVLWLVLRQVLLLAGVGLAIGVPAALAASPVMNSLLFGLGPRDPGTIVLASLAMVLVAIAAGLIPAVRASRMQVFAALRRE
ncbi:MAG: ABC transporter permease [Gemmatimonadetes bacterium]|nr:ABC transporter permease [Gemmatimonadota bacterium]